MGLVLLGGVISPLAAQAVDPTQWTTTVGPMSRDSFGNPKQITFTITGPATSYAICLKMTDAPSYNTKKATYDTYTYSSGGTSYKPCKKFSWSSGASNSRKFGNAFTFGGPGTYEVHWYVPALPTNGGTEVGTVGSFRWADSSDVWSPCPPDPQLQIGVWRTSRHKILNRCLTVSGKVSKASSGPNSLDKDRTWKLSISGSSRQTEYMLRDKTLSSPALGTAWTLTAVSVCDLYHGWKELHPVFQATNGAGTTYLSGPQYSTATPSVSGSWSLHSCG